MPTTLDFKTPHVLRNAAEYRAAVSEVDHPLTLDLKPRTPEYDRLELLSVLVEAYEDDHVPELRESTPQEIVGFMLEQKGIDRGALAEAMGGRSRVSEFFASKRPLSISQVKALRELLGIPADLLVPR